MRAAPGRERPARVRLFVAIEVPERVRDAVERAVAPLRASHADARWVPPQNQHVTVKFLGPTAPERVDAVIESLEHVAVSLRPFATRVNGLGAFPNPRRARVLWAGLDDPDARLAKLAAALDAALAADTEPEKGAFTPHLTIARLDPPAPLGELPAATTEAWEVASVVLFRSHLRRPAPIYEPYRVFPLGV